MMHKYFRPSQQNVPLTDQFYRPAYRLTQPCKWAKMLALSAKSIAMPSHTSSG